MTIYGVSFDSPAENAAFARKYSFPFALLSDDSRALALALGACTDAGSGYPKRVAALLENGAVSRLYPRVSAQTFPGEVLAEL